MALQWQMVTRLGEGASRTMPFSMVGMKIVETCLARKTDPASGMTYHAVSPQQNIWSTPQLFFARKKKTKSLTSLMSAYKSFIIKWAFISVNRATSINKINNKCWFGSSTSTKLFFVYLIPCRIGILKCWFLKRGENQSTGRKTLRSKGENQQQTWSTYGVDAGIWTWAK